MTQLEKELLAFVLSMSTVIFLWGHLNLNLHRAILWKISIIIGMMGIGAGAFAIYIPDLQGEAVPIRVTGVFLMVGMSFISSYRTTAPSVTASTRRTALWAVTGGIIGLVIAVPFLISFRRQQDISAAQYYVLSKMAVRLDSMEARQVRSERKADKIDSWLQDNDSAKAADEVRFRDKVLSNQTRGLKNQAEVKAALKRRQRTAEPPTGPVHIYPNR